jgi:hypothetical protein
MYPPRASGPARWISKTKILTWITVTVLPALQSKAGRVAGHTDCASRAMEYDLRGLEYSQLFFC